MDGSGGVRRRHRGRGDLDTAPAAWTPRGGNTGEIARVRLPSAERFVLRLLAAFLRDGADFRCATRAELGDRMKRRSFIAGLASAAALPLWKARAQTAVPTIGVLASASPAGYAPM